MGTPARMQINREYHGYAAADKANDERTLWVYSEELLPFLQGDISAKEYENQIETSGNKESYSGTLKTANAIQCIYRDTTANTSFPPSVRRGEQVLIYNLGDSNVWYWKSEGRNDNLRRTDTVRYGVSGTLKNTPELDDDNSYFIECDTREKKRIRISTSKVDGEKFRYLLELNADNSQVSLTDDDGNMFIIQSEIPRVCMKNKSESLLDLNIENIIMACKGDMTLKTENGDITLQSGKHITQICKQNWTVNYGGTGYIVASNGGSMTLKCGGFDVIA